MASRTTSIKVTGNVTEAIAALEKLGIKAETVSKETESKFAKAAGGVGSVFGKLSTVVGGEVGELFAKTGEGFDQIGEKAGKLGVKLQVAGATMLGVGAAAQMMGGKDKQAHDQLAQAIDNTGHSYEEYGKDIEETIKKQENYGHSAVQTQQALQILTQATNDPKKALEDMGLASDLAAAKHMGLAEAASVLAKAYSGTLPRQLKEFGIHMSNHTKDEAAVARALTAHQAAVANLARVQRSLMDIELVDHQRKKITLGQQIQLRNAHEAVATALAKVKESQQKLNDAQAAAKKSTDATGTAFEQLAKKVHGQAAASVNNFGGRLQVLKTKLEDGAAQLGQKYGPALTATGATATAAGSLLEMGLGRGIKSAAKHVAGFVKDFGGHLKDIGGKVGSFVADHGRQMATMVANGARWIAAHAVQTAVAIGQYIAQAAAATAAFIAENAATLGIIAGIALLIAAIVFLAMHWRQVWGAIKAIASDVWGFLKKMFGGIIGAEFALFKIELKALEVIWRAVWGAIKAVLSDIWGGIKAIFDTIVHAGIWYIKAEITVLRDIWNAVWGVIRDYLNGVWNTIKAVFGFIVNNGIHLVRDEIQAFQTIWSDVWNGVQTVVQDVWHFISGIFDSIKQGVGDVLGAVGKVAGIAGKIGGGVGKVLGGFLADGGPAKANVPYIVGERGPELFVPSTAGSVIPNHELNSYAGNGNRPAAAQQFGGGVTVNQYLTAQSNASMPALAGELTFALRPYLNH